LPEAKYLKNKDGNENGERFIGGLVDSSFLRMDFAKGFPLPGQENHLMREPETMLRRQESCSDESPVHDGNSLGSP
jgi:hypothetical protein